MDNKQLVRLARLRSLAARAGHPFDLMRFVDDRSFAQQTLGDLMVLDNEDLVVLSLEVLNDLKSADNAEALRQNAATSATPPPVNSSEAAANPSSARRTALEARYIGRLR